MQIELVSLSRKGGRSYNEDVHGHWHDDRYAAFLVSDGAGGHGGGDVAAATALSSILGGYAAHPSFDPQAMRQLVEQANRDIVARQAEGGALAAMRATVVFAVIDYEENHLIWAHSGDSRAYLFRSGALVARTTDHSLVQQLVSGGMLDEEGARRHPQRNILLSALGSVNDPPEISVSEHMKLEAGDAMLLCSDGVWEPLGDKCLQQTLMASRTLTQWSAEIDRQVQARAKPGHDNFTALAIWMVGGDGKTTQLIPSAADQPAAG